MGNNNPCEWVRYKKSLSQCSFLTSNICFIIFFFFFLQCFLQRWKVRRKFLFFLCFSRGLHGWLLLFSFYLISILLLLLALLLPSCIHRRNEIHSHIVTIAYRHTPFSTCSFFLSSSSSSTFVVVIWKNYRAARNKKKFMIASIKNLSPIINMCYHDGMLCSIYLGIVSLLRRKRNGKVLFENYWKSAHTACTWDRRGFRWYMVPSHALSSLVEA